MRKNKFVAIVLVLMATGVIVGAVPRLLNYQGKLTTPDGSGVNGTLPITFSLYTTETGGEPIWTETQNVVVNKGLFSVILGSVTPFPDSVDFSSQYYLEVTVDGETMSTRERLVSAPYSIRAATADRAFNPVYSEINTTRRTGDFVFRAGSGATLTDDGSTINITLGTSSLIPSLVDVLAAGNDAGGRRITHLGEPVDAQDAATRNYVDNYVPSLDRVLRAGNDAGRMQIVNLANPTNDYDAATKFYVDTHSGSGLTGSGSSGQVTVWTGSSSLGTGSIYDNGTSVGIGISSPSATLDVNGTSNFRGEMNLNGNRITNVATPTASTDAANKAYVDAAGGGGAMYWEIKVTSATYNGNLGGYAGANAKCQAEFGSTSFMFNYSILANAYNGGPPVIINLSSAPPSNGAWFGSARAGYSTSYDYNALPYPVYFWGNIYSNSYDAPDCKGWTSTSSSDYGGIIAGTGYRATVTCNNSRPIVCATLKFITP